MPSSGASPGSQLDSVVKNKFAGDAGILSEWATATQIVRPEETPQPQPV